MTLCQQKATPSVYRQHKTKIMVYSIIASEDTRGSIAIPTHQIQHDTHHVTLRRHAIIEQTITLTGFAAPVAAAAALVATAATTLAAVSAAATAAAALEAVVGPGGSGIFLVAVSAVFSSPVGCGCRVRQVGSSQVNFRKGGRRERTW